MLGNFKKLLRGPSRASPPRILTQPQSVHDAIPGSSIALLVMLEGKQSSSSALQFRWEYCSSANSPSHSSTEDKWTPVESGEKERITGQNTSTLLISDLRQADAGSYRCQVTNSSGMTLSRPATLTVVVPPQIESHPVDIREAITGSEAVFSVEVNSQPQANVGTGSRERVQEDLQFGWEVLAAPSSEKCPNSNENDFFHNDKTPETPHQRIFREHHPDLRHYLNTSSILPYLSKYSLVTTEQLEELTLPVLTNTRKVDLVLSWLPRSTVDFLEKFIVCLKEASDHLAHAELASKLEEAMNRERNRSCSQVSEASPPVTPLVTSSSNMDNEGSAEGEWVNVSEREGSVEGTATANLRLLQVEKLQEGQYRCRVTYKGCTIFSRPATLTVLEDNEIVGRLLRECLEVEETAGHTVIGEFLEKYGNSSKLAKKALISVLQCETELPSLVHSFTSRQVPVNFVQDGMTPLHWACTKTHWRIVQHLIRCGASKEALTQEGRNAVHLVCERGDNNSLQFLIHTGAETLVNVQDKYGKTPLHLACEAAQKITPSKLISQDMRDIKTVIQNLIKHPSLLRTVDENGQTPLHLAAMAGHHWIVEVFLLCDTSCLNEQDKDQNTALHIASSLNWPEVVICLLERGANESIENKDHMTPLALAEAKGHTYVADILQGKPGTMKRDRKQTVYLADKKISRPRSVDLDFEGASSPVKSTPNLDPRGSVDQGMQRSESQQFRIQSSFERKFLSSSGIKKLFQGHLEKRRSLCSELQEDPLISGYVHKMEGKKWTKLWCKLVDDCTLYFYKTHEDTCFSASLSLVGYKLEPAPASMTISLLHPKGKPKYNTNFKLDNEPEFTQWVHMLERAMEKDSPLTLNVIVTPPAMQNDFTAP